MVKTALDVPADRLEEQERAFVNRIREHGWTAMDIYGDATGPGFAYTTGFYHSLGVPELITFSLPSQTTNSIFWDLYRRLKEGTRFPECALTDDLLGGDVKACLLPVDKARFEDHLTWTRWFYGGAPIPALQLVWPDKQGNYPFSQAAPAQLLEMQHDMTSGNWAGMSDPRLH